MHLSSKQWLQVDTAVNHYAPHIDIMNEIFDKLDKMNYDELKAWYEDNLLLPSYTTEIDGNMISVQSHFNSQANETILS